jgi:hypothetical protein
MATKPANEPIGEVECMARNCTQVCKVYRFRSGERGSMFKGKLYADCPTHGRISADGKAATQEYILEHATIWGPDKKSVESEPAQEPEIPVSKPTASPTRAKPVQPVKPDHPPQPALFDSWSPLIR